MSGFVWGLLSVVLISLVFGAAAVVLATRAGRVVHAGEPGRGLINAAYVLGYVGIAMSVIFLTTVIGLWIRLHKGALRPPGQNFAPPRRHRTPHPAEAMHRADEGRKELASRLWPG